MNAIQLTVRKFPSLSTLQFLPKTTTDSLYATYRSYVQKTNEILGKLSHSNYEAAHPVYSEFRSRKRELPHALGAVKSFEIFFAHLTEGTSSIPAGTVMEQIRRDFGSWERFMVELRATAIASRGWVSVSFDLDLRILQIQMGDTPEDLTVWNTAPVMIVDVSDRAAAVDFKGDRVAYLDAVMKHIDWTVVERNMDDALGQTAASKPF